MKVSVAYLEPNLEFKIHLDEDDRINPSEKFSLNQKKFSFTLPSEFDFEKIHPDHLALVCLLVCQPFVGKRLECPKPVSKAFAEIANKKTRYDIVNIDENLEPWQPHPNSRPALAFSGGADSTAALSLLPSDTAPIFLDRPSLNSRTLYDRDAAHKACKSLIEIGYEVKMITSDLEYVRNPVGFPIDVANAAPSILLAELMEFDAIAFGTILESTYGIGHEKYRDYPHGNHYQYWGGLFSAAGLPFLQVVSGVSEVGTAIINRNSPIGEYAHSCMRGKWQKPCRKCWKCFRKLLLESAITGTTLTDSEYEELFSIPEAARHLSSFPIKHENVLTYITSKYPTEEVENINLYMDLLKKRVRGDKMETSWMEKYYSPMIEVIPKKYQQELLQKLNRFLSPMSEEEQKNVEEWNMKPMLEDDYYSKLHDSLKFSIS